jgi:hypothetical protein
MNDATRNRRLTAETSVKVNGALMRAPADAGRGREVTAESDDSALRARVMGEPVAVPCDELDEAFRLLAGLLLDLRDARPLSPLRDVPPPPPRGPGWQVRARARGQAPRRVNGIAG